jgi:signal transduction histidine kinase
MSWLVRRVTLIAAAVMAVAATGRGVTALAQPLATDGTRVLLLFDEDKSLPGLSVLEESLRATLTAGMERVDFYSETLSLSQFGGERHEAVISQYFREKYRERQPDLIVAVMGPALQYLLRHGDELFPGVPVVFCGADTADMKTVKLPSTVTGLLVRRTFAPTLDLALQLHPGTRHVYVVGGTSPFDRHLQASARLEFQRFERRAAIEYLTDLAMPDLLARVKTMPANSVVLYLTVFRDAAGNAFVPHSVVTELAAAANAPVYVFVDQYVGLGPVGGFVYSLASHGKGAGQIALRVLHGTSPGTIPIAESEENIPLFDARQLERWGIDATSLPPGAIVQWREPSLWRDHRGTVLSIAGIGAVLVSLVLGLLYERRARRRAEVRTREQLTITSHLGRQLALGEMATALAHELNQPLGTIRLSVAAAVRMLNAGRGSADDLRDILQEIDHEDTRASQIIQRQRAMLQKRDPEHRRLDLNEVVRETVAIVAHEAELRRVRLNLQLSDAPCAITGDQVLLQQVIVNLLINAMDTITQTPASDRIVLVKTTMTQHGAEVSVRDSGDGISDAVLARLFEPFVTTKAKGLGIGLTIARGIVEAHRGKIGATNNPERGATFWFRLPAIESDAVAQSIDNSAPSERAAS